ncbi:3D domain-containing protein [Paenibacillus sp. GCM10012306]|uniref:3D domain-containing protein n=1 Tax=Paenibacillus sp. GCM10012306 TaxID=3317342 RepID=UPI00362347F9
MLEGLLLSLLFVQPTPSFQQPDSLQIIREIKNTYAINQDVNTDIKEEFLKKELHNKQGTLKNILKQQQFVKETKVKPEKKRMKNEEMWLSFEISAYTNGKESTGKTKGNKDYGITSSGKLTKEGRTVSADINLFPYGTVLYIDGVGERIVEDTGRAIKGYKLDLFIEDLQRARNFGRKHNVKVKVLKMGEKKKK